MTAPATWVRSNWLLLVFVFGLILAFAVLRNTPTEGIDSLEALDMSIRAGQPTVLEFYSNFWSTCLLSKPIVDGLEKKLTGKAEVIRLDIFSQVGQQAAARYGVRGVPTLVVVNGNDEIVYGQAGLPRSGQVIEQVDAVLVSN